jgi:HK97 family phage major capsid protein
MTVEEEIKLKAEMESIKGAIDKKLDEAIEKAAGKSKEEMVAVKAELEGTKGEVKQLLEDLKKKQEQLDAIDVKLQRTDPSQGKKSFAGIFADALKSKKGDFEELKNGKKSVSLNFDTKLDDMTQANSFESTVVVPPDQRPGIIYNPARAARIRDLISTGTTTSNNVPFVREYAITSNTDVTTEGSEYKQEDFDLKLINAAVIKITNYIIASEEMFEDVDGLTSYVLARLPEKIKNEEDDQILNNATYGILTLGTAYVDALADSKVQRIDVLVDALRQVADDEYRATAIVLHPVDATYMKLTKDDNGQYIFPWIFMNGGVAVDGIPVVVTTAMTSGTFLVGDFKLGAQIFDRRQIAIEFSNQNEDNFVKGMVTVRGSERIAIAVYRPAAFVYGTFAAALAKGSA